MSKEATEELATEELVEDLVKFDPEIGQLLAKEQALIKVSKIDEDFGKNTDVVDELLLDTHAENSEKIEAALKSDPDTMKNVDKLVQARLKEYGGIENTLVKLRNVDITKVPRFILKPLRNHLQNIIPVLKSRNAKQDFIVILEDLLKKIIDYLLKTSKKLRNRVGGKLNKTKKRIIKGGNEGMLFAIGVVAFLIACCLTGIGCIICGPLLVAIFCLGIGAEICAAIGNVISSIANAFSSTSVAVAVPVGTPSVPVAVPVGTPSVPVAVPVGTSSVPVGTSSVPVAVPVGTPSVSVGKPGGKEKKEEKRKGGKTKRRRRHK